MRDEKNDGVFNPSESEEYAEHIKEVLHEDDSDKLSIEIPEQGTFQWIDIDSEVKKEEKEDTVTTETSENKSNEADEEKKLVENISNSIAEQVNDSLMELNDTQEEEKSNSADHNEDEEYSNHIEESQSLEEKSSVKSKYLYLGKLKIPRFLRPALIVLASILVLGVFLVCTKPGQYIIFKVAADYVTGRMEYNDGSEDVLLEEVDEVEELATDITQLKEEDIKLNADEGVMRNEDYAINILLLGEEAIDAGTSRGRTDLIMIATLNTKQKSMKLTSIMRDTYVQIPGYKDNKINASYQFGGIELLYETIELNFDVQIDGYCLVGFDSFEEIIDALGGIDIEINGAEAEWLNTTNYITEESNKNLVAGVNHMNGDQALGYCRIRQVGTIGKEYDDFGRTSRQRTVLNAIFEKYKELSLIDLMVIANQIFPMVKTDITSDEMTKYMQTAYNIGIKEIENYRIPAAGTYRSTYVRSMSVLIPNLSENVTILHEYIFGKEDEQ